ncbi:AAEL017038-PA [Aedes aegypti]|nr:AAEL017038-PA [Aedes aegypti]
MNRSGNPPAEDIPLNTVRPDANDVVDGNGGKFAQKIDLHSYAGLTTILAVNLQQLYLLFTVGPELGPMFYILTTLSLISAVLVTALLPIRYILEKGLTSKILYYTSLVLYILILVFNLALQIFDHTVEKCQVLLNQPLPPVQTSDNIPK